MSDTATGTAPTGTDPTTRVKRSQKPRNVDYTLEVVDDLPDDIVTRHSPLEDALEKIVADEQFHGKFVRIGAYPNGSAASAAANVLRQRHGGTPAVEGFTIRPKRFTQKGEDGAPDQELTGLFVKYEPGSIIEGARAEWDEKERARKDAIVQKRVAAGKSPESTLPGNRPAKAGANDGAQDAANGKAEGKAAPSSQPAPSGDKGNAAAAAAGSGSKGR